MNISTQNIPITNKTNLYMDGLTYSTTDITGQTIIIDSGSCRDQNNIMDIVIKDPITINITHFGLGGLDTGTLNPNWCYGICVVGDSSNNNKPSAMIFDQYNQREPILPPNYDSWRVIGYVAIDSSKIISYTLFGNSLDRYLKYTTPVSLNIAGSVTTSMQFFDASHIFPNVSYQLVDISTSFRASVAASVGNLATFEDDPKFHTIYGITANVIINNLLTVLISNDSNPQSDPSIITIGVWASVGLMADSFVFYAYGFRFNV